MFFMYRSHCVKLADAISLYREAGIGVPQGLVIRPIICLVCPIDLGDLLADNFLVCADDMRLIYPRSKSLFLSHRLFIFQSLSVKFQLPLNASTNDHIAVGCDI